jgi:hypothetical protein
MGRSDMQAACPACDSDLIAANAKQFSIQLVGGNSSGKTAFLSAFWQLYSDNVNGIKNLTISGEPYDCFDSLENMYRTGLTESSSATSALAYSLLHRFNRAAKHNLVFFDIPDEVVLSGAYERNPRNLGFSDGIIFIVDPLSVAVVRDECLKSGSNHEIGKYSVDDVGELIIEFVHQLSGITGRSARKQSNIPVAIVINKADIKAVQREIGLSKIKAAYEANPAAYNNDETIARDDICRTYLSKLGFDNALNNLDGTFSNIRYFPVSAIGHAGGNGKPFAPIGILAPVVWIANEAKSALYPMLKSAKDAD